MSCAQAAGLQQVSSAWIRRSQSHRRKSLTCPSSGSGALQQFEAAASRAAVCQTSSIVLFLFGSRNIRGQCLSCSRPAFTFDTRCSFFRGSVSRRLPLFAPVKRSSSPSTWRRWQPWLKSKTTSASIAVCDQMPTHARFVDFTRRWITCRQCYCSD